MTASAQLRRRYTQQAAVAVAVSFTLAIILAIVGARTLASSTIGSEAGGDQGETVIALPETTTAFIGVVDDGWEVAAGLHRAHRQTAHAFI